MKHHCLEGPNVPRSKVRPEVLAPPKETVRRQGSYNCLNVDMCLSGKRDSEAVLTRGRIGYTSRTTCSDRTVTRFQGSSSSMRLIGCSAMHGRTSRRYFSG